MAKELTGTERRELVAALLSAFPNEDDLGMAVDLLDVQYDQIIEGNNYANRVKSLVDWAEAQGHTLDLIVACRKDNPGNPKLKAFAEKYLSENPTAGTPEEKIPTIPEAMPFRARDERLPYFWLEAAVRAAKSVARLQVSRVVDGQVDDRPGFGTGWLLTPSLLLTNHHVIEGRNRRAEPPARKSDLEAQVRGIEARFDYVQEGGGVAVKGFELVQASEALDYAVLRLSEPLPDRRGLPIAGPEVVEPGRRVNILQHSGGHPLRIAIRNNFVVPLREDAEGKGLLRYLTETEKGASGSPVLNDQWQVVALHHAAVNAAGDPNAAKFDEAGNPTAEAAMFHNEGINIHAVLADLPAEIQAEIQAGRT